MQLRDKCNLEIVYSNCRIDEATGIQDLVNDKLVPLVSQSCLSNETLL